jgi:hypothetical protein
MEFIYFVADTQPHSFGAVAALPAAQTATLETMLLAQGFRSATLVEYQAASDAACANQTAPAPQPESGTTDNIAATVLKAPKRKGKKDDTDEDQTEETPDIQDQIEDQAPPDANT